MENKVIVCLAGQKRSGKDSVGSVLKSEGFEQMALADSLRELCSVAFEIPLNVFTDDNLKENPFERPILLKPDHLAIIESIVEKEWGFVIDPYCHGRLLSCLETELKHPRHILQYVGTELLRSNIDDQIFLKVADKKISECSKDIVITDCRFSNEREWFRKKGATICLVKRPSLAVSKDTHASENDLGEDKDYDVIITNDSDLNQLKLNVSMWINMTFRRRR